MSDGLMDNGPVFKGRNLLVSVILGLVLFTLVSMFITLFIGRYFGHVLNKKALENERDIQSKRLIDRESTEKH